MIKISSRSYPFVGISYSKLLEIAKNKGYFSWRVESSGVNMILINNKFSEIFQDIENSFKSNVLYDHIFTEEEMKKIDKLFF